MLNKITRKTIQEYIDNENGIDYHKNIPLDGFILTYGESFIAFSIKEINNINVAILHYMYFLDSKSYISLLSASINLWTGYNVKMIYGREHKRKSNVVKQLTNLDLSVMETRFNNWKHKWTSTNGFSEDECFEVMTMPQGVKKSKKTVSA